jgi:hypothetical protein
VQLEGLGKLKNSISLGLEPDIFLLVAVPEPTTLPRAPSILGSALKVVGRVCIFCALLRYTRVVPTLYEIQFQHSEIPKKWLVLKE